MSTDDTPSLDDVVATATYGVVNEVVGLAYRDAFVVQPHATLPSSTFGVPCSSQLSLERLEDN